MGSVIERARFGRRKKVYLAIFATYFVAAFAFVTIGLQPVAENSAAVYAAEAESATERLKIAEIGLDAPVKLVAVTDAELEVPEQIAGAYSAHENKTLLIGHSSTIFARLNELAVGAELSYAGRDYQVVAITEQPKEEISMKEVLRGEEQETLVLMTCAGELIPGTKGDHTRRLIIMAVALN